jgi:hypothetical protein
MRSKNKDEGRGAWGETLESNFHDVLGFRARNEHGGSDFEFEAPEFLAAGEILCWLAGSAACDKRKISFCGSKIKRLFGVRVNPGAIAPERVHQEKFGGKRVRGDARGAQPRHGFFQCGANISSEHVVFHEVRLRQWCALAGRRAHHASTSSCFRRSDSKWALSASTIGPSLPSITRSS